MCLVIAWIATFFYCNNRKRKWENRQAKRQRGLSNMQRLSKFRSFKNPGLGL